MGIFQDHVEIVNRTPVRLPVLYDGQRTYLEPNYTADGEPIENVRNTLPRQVIPFALNQLVIPGSEKIHDPSDFRSYIGVIDYKANKKKKYSWFDCSFQPIVESEITRVSQEAIMDEIADPKTKMSVRGKKASTESPGERGKMFDLRPSV